MTNTNIVVLVGRLVSDSKLAYFNGGTAVNDFTIAVNRTRQSQNGKIDEVSYFDIKVYGKIGETLKPYLVKGKQVSISGSLVQKRWEKDGYKMSKVEIVADNVELLGGQSTGQPQGQYQAPPQQQGQYQGQYQAPQDYNNSGFPDDIPF